MSPLPESKATQFSAKDSEKRLYKAGDWHVEQTMVCGSTRYRVVSSVDGGAVLADTRFEGKARLISAAPDMAEALQAILPAMRDNQFSGTIVALAGGQIEGADLQRKLVAKIEVALLKAGL